MMEIRQLGRSGIAVSALGLGCMGMSEFYGPQEDDRSLATLERAQQLGVTFLDTADMYGVGHNETLVGRFLASRRDRFVLATKFGIVRDPDGTRRGIDNSPDYIRKACDASLKRLGVEVIDLYYAHRIDRSRPIEETVGAMAGLVEAGKVRAIGLSEVSAATLKKAHAVHPIAAVQSEWSLWSRDPEVNGVLAACRELGVAFVPYSPLGRGFLTGRMDGTEGLAPNDFRRFSPRLLAGNLERNLALVAKVKALAAAKGCSPGQLVLAWLLAQGQDVIPIPGTTRINHLEENVQAAALKLTVEEIRAIGDAVPPGAAAGTRYTEDGMRTLDA